MNIDNRDVFEQIGNLFYAVATDQRVQPIEVGELKLLIGEDWIPHASQGHIVSEESHFILVAIDNLLAAKTSSEEAYRQFAKFYSFNENLFTKELRRRIFHTAAGIVKVFKADNVSFNQHFDSLRKLFQIKENAKV